MRRIFAALTCGIVLVAQARAGEEKVHAVGKDGLKITGTIAANDPKVKVNEPNLNISAELAAKVHLVKLQAGVKYRIDLEAPKFDPVLAIQDEAGKQVAFNDDISNDNLNSRLEFMPAKDGTYKIVTASLKDVGAFTLSITEAGKGGKEPVGGKDVKFEGKVSDDDPKFKLGAKALSHKVHEAKLLAGKKYQFDLVKKDGSIDPFLILQDSGGKVLLFDDDGGGFPNSRMTFNCPKDGTYKLLAAALDGEGDYVLTIKEVPLSKDELTVHEVGAAGLKIAGKLNQKTRLITYQVKFEAGKEYVIDMTSPNQKALDPYLILIDSAGKRIAENDDIAMDNLDARITHKAAAAGTYRIVATSFMNAGFGDFTLEVRLKE